MSDTLPSILETNIFSALRAFITSLVACPVIRTPVNRAAMPTGDFIALTPMGRTPLSTNTDAYTASSETILSPVQYTVQVDCYGAAAGDRANTLSSLFRDDYACQSFISSGFDVQPLFATDARQMPLVSGEDQYIERWTFECVMQANPVVTIAAQTADALVVNLINVDATYPP
jgi:hypothetical protein